MHGLPEAKVVIQWRFIASDQKRTNMNNGKRYGTLFINALVGVIVLHLAAGYAAAGPAYPLKLAPGKHYIVDANGNPFFIMGDSPWYLTENLTDSNANYYLSNRWAQGYNSIILDITAMAQNDLQGDDTNQYGQHPFTNTIGGWTNLLTWNINYFTNVDWVLNDASNYGFCCFLYPLYDNQGNAWFAQMKNNTTNALFAYGQFIGNRYKNFPNIVWIGAGDWDEPNAPTNCLWNWVAAGILSADTNHLITAQPYRSEKAEVVYSNFVSGTLGVEATYVSQNAYNEALADYNFTPTLAAFSREPYYEHRIVEGVENTALICRNYSYGGVFWGDTSGTFWGNEEQWPFTNGWQTQMVDVASLTMPNLSKLMRSRLWYNFVPDSNNVTVVNNYGYLNTPNFVVGDRESSGKTVMAYISQAFSASSPLAPTIDMTKISGSTAACWWYNPSNGVASFISSNATTGTKTFTPPDTNDWVLVLDDASQNYPPPGVGNAPGKISLGFQALGGNVYDLTVTGMPGQAFKLQYTTNFSVSWQILGSGTIDNTGTISYYLIAMSSAIFFRALDQ